MAMHLNKIEILPDKTVQLRFINTDTGQFYREVLKPEDAARAMQLGGDVAKVCAAVWGDGQTEEAPYAHNS